MEITDFLREMIKKWKKRYEDDIKQFEKLPPQLADDMSEDVFISSARVNYWSTRLELSQRLQRKIKEEEERAK